MDHEFSFKSPLVEMNKFKQYMDEYNSISMSPIIQSQREWNPYSSQGGTTSVLSGDDFVVVASDSRLTGENKIEILSRNCEKTHVLTNKIIFTACGYYGDVLQMKRLLKLRINHYEFGYQKPMSLEECGQMVAETLYSRRFFPYYTGGILCGINSKGRGTLYSYDPIGCVEIIPFEATGSGGHTLTTFFENQWAFSTVGSEERKNMPKQTLERALSVTRDGFRGLSERESTTGDFLNVLWIKAGDDEVHRQTYRLRGD